MLKLAFCGCGKVAEHHVTATRRFGSPVTLACTIDVKAERHAAIQQLAASECPAFESLAAALASGVEFDAVAILLPHHLHEDAAKQALEAGKHVLLEKPMAVDLFACKRILDVASRFPKQVFAVGENASFWPEVRIARSLIRQGAIGDVVTARAHYYEAMASTPFGGSDTAQSDRDNLGWRASKEQCGGGIILDGGQHWIRALREFMGDIVSVVAVTSNPGTFIEGESLAHAIFRHESGKTSSYQATLLSSEAAMAHATESWFRVTGQRGEIVITGSFVGGIKLYDSEHPHGVDVIDHPCETEGGLPASIFSLPCAVGGEGGDGSAPSPASGFVDSFGPQMTGFARACLTAGGDSPVSLLRPAAHALGELRVALAIYRSAASGSWEAVGNGEDGDGEW
mmetsp:Transcript_133445/g.414974  ORF Transcript_133445/g.414974 Transcript_133445/m.414974 type:complete len:398 (+) Transcript_133445:208-1401(+)